VLTQLCVALEPERPHTAPTYAVHGRSIAVVEARAIG
jgi:hypothetical protein